MVVPDVAVPVEIAWDATYIELAAWAHAVSAAYEAMAEGREPNMGYVRHRLTEAEHAQKRATSEETKLLESLRLSPTELRELYSHQGYESWSPDPDEP